MLAMIRKSNKIPELLLLFALGFEEPLLLIELKKLAAPVRRNIQNMFYSVNMMMINNLFLLLTITNL